MRSLNWVQVDAVSEIAKTFTSIVEALPFKGLNVGNCEICATFVLILIMALMVLFGQLAYMEEGLSPKTFLEDGQLINLNPDLENYDDILVKKVSTLKVEARFNPSESSDQTFRNVFGEATDKTSSTYQDPDIVEPGDFVEILATSDGDDSDSSNQIQAFTNIQYKDTGTAKTMNNFEMINSVELPNQSKISLEMSDPARTTSRSRLSPKLDEILESMSSEYIPKVQYNKSVKSNLRVTNVAKMKVRQDEKFDVPGGDEFYRESHVYEFIPPDDSEPLIQEEVICPTFAKSTLVGNPPPTMVSRDVFIKGTNNPIDMDFKEQEVKSEPKIPHYLL